MLIRNLRHNCNQPGNLFFLIYEIHKSRGESRPFSLKSVTTPQNRYKQFCALQINLIQLKWFTFIFEDSKTYTKFNQKRNQLNQQGTYICDKTMGRSKKTKKSIQLLDILIYVIILLLLKKSCICFLNYLNKIINFF
ncbi:hypothetical protein pb186bvf_021171 [Paramecium bursaria]